MQREVLKRKEGVTRSAIRAATACSVLAVLGACEGGSGNPASASEGMTGTWLGSCDDKPIRLVLTEEPGRGFQPNVSGSCECLDSPIPESWRVEGYSSETPFLNLVAADGSPSEGSPACLPPAASGRRGGQFGFRWSSSSQLTGEFQPGDLTDWSAPGARGFPVTLLRQ
jgi:hypothetical protein